MKSTTLVKKFRHFIEKNYNSPKISLHSQTVQISSENSVLN